MQVIAHLVNRKNPIHVAAHVIREDNYSLDSTGFGSVPTGTNPASVKAGSVEVGFRDDGPMTLVMLDKDNRIIGRLNRVEAWQIR